MSVIPAQVGIQWITFSIPRGLDSRLRGNDGEVANRFSDKA